MEPHKYKHILVKINLIKTKGNRVRACKVPNTLNLFFHLLPSSLSNDGVAWYTERKLFSLPVVQIVEIS